MKRVVFIICCILINIIPVFSETAAEPERSINVMKETYKINGKIEYNDNPVETIYLDDNIEKPHVNIQKRSITLPVRNLNITSNSDSTRSALARAVIAQNSLTDIMPLSGRVVENIGGFSYGQSWEQDVSLSQIESTMAFFVRYDANKFFALTTAVRQTSSQDIGKQYNSLKITPEWHITDKLTLKDSFTTYIDLPKTKNQITLVYSPMLKKYADMLKFELGVAQSYYRNGSQSAEVSFSTGFRL